MDLLWYLVLLPKQKLVIRVHHIVACLFQMLLVHQIFDGLCHLNCIRNLLYTYLRI